MPFPKLSPLQSRFAASLTATLFLIILYFVLSSPRLAYAIDVESIIQDDHNHPISPNFHVSPGKVEWKLGTDGYSELSLETLDIVKRAPAGVDSLANNEPRLKNIQKGETQYWVFPKEALAGPKSPPTPGLPPVARSHLEDPEHKVLQEELRRRDGALLGRSVAVYLTVNTCLQPFLNSTRQSNDNGPSQLRMYISQSASTQKPGPGADPASVTVILLDEGYATATLGADGDVFIGISAPNNTRYSGIYNYEIAASIDAPFHNLDTTTPYLFFVDGDSGTALLQTNDTTQADPDDDIYRQWMKLDPPPFTMFAHNMDDYDILGLQKSYCGLSKNAQISKSSNNVQVEMTNRGINHKPKEQFYVKNLNASSTYYGFLAMEGNSTNSGSGVVGGGGKVWKPMNFTTKSGTYILCFQPVDSKII
jgi:calcium channel MID1